MGRKHFTTWKKREHKQGYIEVYKVAKFVFSFFTRVENAAKSLILQHRFIFRQNCFWCEKWDIFADFQPMWLCGHGWALWQKSVLMLMSSTQTSNHAGAWLFAYPRQPLLEYVFCNQNLKMHHFEVQNFFSEAWWWGPIGQFSCSVNKHLLSNWWWGKMTLRKMVNCTWVYELPFTNTLYHLVPKIEQCDTRVCKGA